MEFVLGLIYYRGERIRKEMKELEWVGENKKFVLWLIDYSKLATRTS